LKKNRNDFLTVPCFDPWFHMTIRVDGRAISCDVNTDNAENARNKSLEKIWYGKYFDSIRQQMINCELPQYCAQCNPSHITQRRRLRMEIMKNLGD